METIKDRKKASGLSDREVSVYVSLCFGKASGAFFRFFAHYDMFFIVWGEGNQSSIDFRMRRSC